MYKIKVWYGNDHWVIIYSEHTVLYNYITAKGNDYLVVEDDKIIIPFSQIVMMEEI